GGRGCAQSTGRDVACNCSQRWRRSAADSVEQTPRVALPPGDGTQRRYWREGPIYLLKVSAQHWDLTPNSFVRALDRQLLGLHCCSCSLTETKKPCRRLREIRWQKTALPFKRRTARLC